MVNKYLLFLEEKTIRELEEYILLINESDNKKSVWELGLNKIKNLPKESKVRVIRWLILSTIGVGGALQIKDMVSQLNAPKEDIEIVKKEVEKYENYRPAYEFKLSKNGADSIKQMEKLELKAYRLGDGKITVGWGHAEPVGKSKYKVGQTISMEEANKLFMEDATKAADGVRRIFKQWENEEKIVVPITQGMFDALVSIAFNSGVGGLRRSKIIKHLKKKEYKSAKNAIYSHNLGKFAKGLGKRRKVEASMFSFNFDKN